MIHPSPLGEIFSNSGTLRKWFAISLPLSSRILPYLVYTAGTKQPLALYSNTSFRRNVETSECLTNGSVEFRLKVTCDGTHLHYIKAYQFVDSPEWEAMQENIDDVFQVTIRAEESSTYICWTRLKLLRVLRHRPLLKVVLNTLIGKDITSKLYALNEQLAGVAAASETTTSNPYRGVARSLSVDAVNTETAGRVRSTTWKAQRRHSNPRSDSKFLRSSFSIQSFVKEGMRYLKTEHVNYRMGSSEYRRKYWKFVYQVDLSVSLR